MEAHNAAVTAISQRVKKFHARKEPFRLYHGSTNSTRQSHRRADNTIDTSKLNHVLRVDTTSKTALAEPNVAMDELVAAALPHGLAPCVVTEFPGITVGGSFSGTSGESSSFRYGAFDANVNSIEIVLADGTVTKASKHEPGTKDLFWGAASAFGTLGVVTLLEVQLRDAAKFVELTYRLCQSPAESVKVLEDECAKDANDYVDGIVYSPDSTVICSGRHVDQLPPGAKAQTFTRRGDPWFYLHAKKKLTRRMSTTTTKEDIVTDYIPTTDYFFRYDRGGFWVARYSFRYFLTPFNRITRYLLDPLLHARVMYRAVHQSGLVDYYMLQDVGVPNDRAVEFQDWLHDSFAIYPLWLCPLRVQRDDPESAHGLHSDFARPGAPNLLNFGVWGPMTGCRGDRREAIRRNRQLEQKVQELGGKKWLYAQAFYTEDEFWAHYDRASYDALREKYAATYLPSVYDKVKVDFDKEEAEAKARGFRRAWPLPGLKGVYKAVVGGDYLLQKKRTQQKSSHK